MERLADPRVYQCALQQSLEQVDYVLDIAPYTYCPRATDIINPETDEPVSSLHCYATRKTIAEAQKRGQKTVEHPYEQ